MGIPLSVLRSFRSRILALVLGLVTLVLTAAIVGIAVKARAEVQRQADVQLQTAAGTAREVLKFRGSQLATAVEVLTSDFGFKEAVSSADAPTLLSAVENQRNRIGANLVIVLTPEGRPVASAPGTLSAATEKDLRSLIAGDGDSSILQTYRLIDGRPYQLVLAPVLAPDPIGWTAMGFELDDRVAADMSRSSSVSRSPSWRVITWHHRRTHTCTTASSASKHAPEATPFVADADGDKLLTWTNPIRSANGALTLVLQRSLSSALRPYDDVRNSMLAIGALLLAVATVLAVLLARSATKPVEDLTKAVERLEAGDYGVEVPHAGTTRAEGACNRLQCHARRGRGSRGDDPPSGGPQSVDRTADARAHQRDPRSDPDPGAHPRTARSPSALIEIHQFQSIIGSFGHAAGDQVLSRSGAPSRRRTAAGPTRRAHRHRSIPRHPGIRRPDTGGRSVPPTSSSSCAARSTTRASRSSWKCAPAPPYSPPTATVRPSCCSAPTSRCFAPRKPAPRSACIIERR